MEKGFYCEKCNGTSPYSTRCENTSCPNQMCCDKPLSECTCTLIQPDTYNTNKIIQKFMGAERIIGYTGSSDEIPYHQDWARLMGVVEKICRTQIGDDITYVKYATPRTFGMLNEETGKIMVRLNGFQVFEADTLIEATYKAVSHLINFLENEKEKK